MKSIKILGALALCLCLANCGNSEESTNPMDGVWQSVGYGRIVKIEQGAFKLAQTTSISCLPVLSGDIAMFGDQIYVENDTLRLDNGINRYLFTRIDDAPLICKNRDTTAYADPVLNFEVVAETFRDHYAYFKERNINWDSTYALYRAKVTPQTTDAELYNVLEDMLDSFDDGHIGLSASDEVEEAAYALREAAESDESESGPTPISGRRVRDSIANHYVKDLKVSTFGFFQWGKINEKVGYLQLNQMLGFADYGIEQTDDIEAFFEQYFEMAEEAIRHSDNEVAGINRLFNQVLDDFKGVEALIIDVRFNGGGSDEIGMVVLSFFNPQRKQVFSKQAWFQGALTPENKVYLHAGERQSTLPVYLLISPESASATEIMTLTSLEIPSVTRIGDRTEGVFSDIFDREMPNGMEFGLSNEVYYSMKGENYEGLGIPADVVMNYPRSRYVFFYQVLDQLNNGVDAAIEEVLKLHQ
ncbi:S41 family peptidase [Gilvibacter sp.]|uniref:S41 family peptidase n=1 Tax=Gilvibacter sp. TaxID=2729997 RepID=UPI0025BABD50|nr:S41 family peptidase [Gilvibacter sp.]NQX78639.1 S41 family peptidase [Gilvibacter sp.]